MAQPISIAATEGAAAPFQGDAVPLLMRSDAAALVTIVLITGSSLVLANVIGLRMADPLWAFGLAPAFLFVLAMGYHHLRPSEHTLFPMLYYSSLWLILPVAGVQLSYVAATSGAPLQDELFFKLDRAIGYDWLAWAEFVQATDWLHWVTARAYMSYGIQPYVAVVIVALFAPRQRNAEFLIATCIAMLSTIGISAALPAIEPGWHFGYPAPAADVMIMLRSEQFDALPYIGIICFPSFHSASAILFTWVYRGIWWAMVPATLLNVAMLAGVPFSGDHYLIDILAGIALAIGAAAAAPHVLCALNRPLTVNPYASGRPADNPSRSPG